MREILGVWGLALSIGQAPKHRPNQRPCVFCALLCYSLHTFSRLTLNQSRFVSKPESKEGPIAIGRHFTVPIRKTRFDPPRISFETL